jgi:multiple sugar transport system substrate-binding protein
LLGLSAGVAAAVALDACSGSGSTAGTTATATVSQAEIDTAMKTPTTLTFWTWVPNISQEVALFEQKYPAIKVNVVNAGQSSAQYTKLRTALTAGKGTPDLAQIEFSFIPTFTITDSLVDLRPYGASANKGRSSSTGCGAGDRVQRRGLRVPAGHRPDGPAVPRGHLRRSTASRSRRPGTTSRRRPASCTQPTPGSTSRTCRTTTSGAWQGLMWQAGARPYTVRGTSVGLAVDDAASKKVAGYWGGLVSEGVVSTDPDFTNTWYTGLNTGKYATWLTAAWGPVFLTGTAKATIGQVAGRTAPAVGAGPVKLG